nr:MAG TPA: hypothetical protein [Caudoviricetes sp.]
MVFPLFVQKFYYFFCARFFHYISPLIFYSLSPIPLLYNSLFCNIMQRKEPDATRYLNTTSSTR